ncbi:hypothetical protein VEJY3_09620 [Vibrio sp. EJY3]|nr:DUF3265 domain-containing protein [Vibrio furnissii]AEX22404.1 hypothetical protein VEJY3_09620 [Vibrio sp. EJY3]
MWQSNHRKSWSRVSIAYATYRELTKCSRGIRNAWHFRYALVFVFKVVCSNIGIALLTP